MGSEKLSVWKPLPSKNNYSGGEMVRNLTQKINLLTQIYYRVMRGAPGKSNPRAFDTNEFRSAQIAFV